MDTAEIRVAEDARAAGLAVCLALLGTASAMLGVASTLAPWFLTAEKSVIPDQWRAMAVGRTGVGWLLMAAVGAWAFAELLRCVGCTACRPSRWRIAANTASVVLLIALVALAYVGVVSHLWPMAHRQTLTAAGAGFTGAALSFYSSAIMASPLFWRGRQITIMVSGGVCFCLIAWMSATITLAFYSCIL
jgi:hypothetical protein